MRHGRCPKDHRTYRTLAKCEWPHAEWVAGEGPFMNTAEDGLPLVEPDAIIGPELRDGEHLHAVREGALMNRLDGGPMPGYSGRLYLTDRRIVHVGQALFSLALSTADAGMRSVFAEARGGDATLRQPALARTLSAIAVRGWREFYAGDTGASIGSS